jgi:hypothetical protein
VRAADDAIAVFIWYAWSAALVFVLGYSWMTPWWERRPGWVASLHGWAFLLLTTPFILKYAIHVNTTHLWFAWYYAGSFFAAGTVEYLRLYLVWSLQPKGRRRRS